MTWGIIAWLWALVAVFLVGVLAVWGGRRHNRRLAERLRGALYERVLPSSVRRRRWFADALRVLGLVAFVVALAEPQFGKRIVEVQQRGVDLVLVVDVSVSMDATDVDPSRMERARREVFDLIELLEGDRVGLVLFAGGAFPRMPLTNDHDALRLLARELDTRTFVNQGSELGAAITEAMDLLADSTQSAGKAILILSDGEVHRVDEAIAAARQARDAGVVIEALGIGVKPAPIPLRDGTWLEHGGQRVISAPSADVLREVARITGGAYAQSVASSEDMRELIGQLRGSVSSEVTGTLQREVPNTSFPVPLGLGVICWLLAAWMGDGRSRLGGGVWLFLGGMLLLPVGEAWAQDLADGDAAYRAGDFAQAERVFEQLVAETPSDATLYGRLGAARYRSGDFDGAARAYETQARLMAGESSEALYNAGNAHYRSGRLERALELYDQVLEQRPKHERATKNKELVAQELMMRRQQQQQQQQQQSGDGGEQKPSDQAPKPSEDAPQQGESEGDEPQQQGDQSSEEQGDPSSDGDPGDAEQQGDQGSSGEDGEPTQSEAVSPSELDDPQGETPGEPGGEPSGEPVEDGNMTAAQAQRMLDGVEEGRPRVRINTQGGDRPW